MHQRAFTLIELLVVIAIVGILSTIVIASLDTARDKSAIAAGESYDATTRHALGDTEVGYWKLDEDPAGGKAGDESGNGNTCTVNGTVTSTTGVHGNAFLFDGSTGWLSCGSKSMFALTTKWTITLWVKPNDVTSFTTLIDGDGLGDPTGGWDVYVSTGRIEYETNNLNAIYSNAGLVTGKWQQVAVTYDSAQSPNTHFYINGAAAGTGSIVAPSAFTSVDIARRGAGSFFNGAIDEVHVYNQTLSTSDVRDRYARELAALDQ